MVDDLVRAKDLVELLNAIDRAVEILKSQPVGQQRDSLIAKFLDIRADGDALLSGAMRIADAPMSSKMS